MRLSQVLHRHAGIQGHEGILEGNPDTSNVITVSERPKSSELLTLLNACSTNTTSLHPIPPATERYSIPYWPHASGYRWFRPHAGRMLGSEYLPMAGPSSTTNQHILLCKTLGYPICSAWHGFMRSSRPTQWMPRRPSTESCHSHGAPRVMPSSTSHRGGPINVGMSQDGGTSPVTSLSGV